MQALYLEIKNLIITTLNLDELSTDDIDTEAALFGDGLGLDSIDALELGLAVKNQYGVVLSAESEEMRQHFFSVATLASFINAQRAGGESVMTDQHAIYNEVSALLVKLFEIDPQEIKPEARLYDDLELDSIDAVDMIVHLQKKTGKKIKPEEFKAVRTVQDVVDAVERLLKEA